MKTLFNKLCIKHFGISSDKLKRILKYSFNEVNSYKELTAREKDILDTEDFYSLKQTLK